MALELEAMVQLIGSLGVAAVLGWYLYYTTTSSFPRMHAQMLERLDKMQAAQNEVIARVCADFTQSLREERLTRREEIAMLREELNAKRCERPNGEA